MKLMTKELESRFPKLYQTEGVSFNKIKVIAKYFDPCSEWTWYATEYDPKERRFFGLVRGHALELGYFSLTELESIVNRYGLGIERDLFFGECTLADVMKNKL